MMPEAPSRSRRPSLRRRLVVVLTVPMLALLLLAGGLIYRSVLEFDRKEYDRALLANARSVVALMEAQGRIGPLSPEVHYLLSYDLEGTSYFLVRSLRHGLLGSTSPHPTPPTEPEVGAEPVLFDAVLATQRVRGVTLRFHPRAEPDDTISVTMAETLQSRERLAREVLLILLLLEGLLIAGLLLLVRAGVRFGLGSLRPLVEQLRRREREGSQHLDPLTDADVPKEILPLTQTIDALFRRLRDTLDVQEHFIADAAHQLRTPLAGLMLHVERARHSGDPAELRATLDQIAQLTTRAARTSTQLLSLMRAQSSQDLDEPPRPVDLAALAVETVSRRVPDALRDGVDLGYQGPQDGCVAEGYDASLRDMIENLIDNALLYAGRGHSVTVSVRTAAAGEVELSVEDDGPGVPDLYVHRLGERFFRVPGSPTGGTGLGLAIVRRIADRHRASVQFMKGSTAGLRVALSFPPCQAVTAP